MRSKYLIITPAHNEEQNIEKLILSVINQTITPETWIIVNDRSNDTTEDIIKSYLDKNSFIKYIKIEGKPKHSFGAKVHAINTALDTINIINFNFIGILDADISLNKDYFEHILTHFNNNRELGIAGGKIIQYINGKYHEHIKAQDSVAGAVQFFRRECFEDTDGFVPREYGGEDTILEMTARMKGWHVKTIFEDEVIHYGKVSYAGFLPRLRRGYSFYTLGYNPLFHLMRCVYRLNEKPVITGSIAELFGYVYASFSVKIEVSQELKNFIRHEQFGKIKKIFRLDRFIKN